jgi:hypothetical protein
MVKLFCFTQNCGLRVGNKSDIASGSTQSHLHIINKSRMQKMKANEKGQGRHCRVTTSSLQQISRSHGQRLLGELNALIKHRTKTQVEHIRDIIGLWSPGRCRTSFREHISSSLNVPRRELKPRFRLDRWIILVYQELVELVIVHVIHKSAEILTIQLCLECPCSIRISEA